MSRTASPFLGPREELAALTLVGPRAILGKLRELSERVGVSRHVLAALAIDEYISRHYPDAPRAGGVEQTKPSSRVSS
jgi:hypothetical protein